MALDGTLLYSITEELKQELIGGKINKVFQPEKDEIHLVIRHHKKNYRLLLSANSNYPRIHLTEKTKPNPEKAPSFVMLLRKSLQNGRIIDFQQPHFDRVIKIIVESYDELNVMRKTELIIEMMGKHSNILLVEGSENKILDSIKRVGFEVSSFRQVLPGLPYVHPPIGEQVSPFNVSSILAFKEILHQSPNEDLIRGVFTNLIGFSPLISRELIHRSGLSETLLVKDLQDHELYELYKEFKALMEFLKEKKKEPVVYLLKGKPKAFGVYPLDHLELYEKKPFDHISGLLEYFYETKDHKERLKQKSQDLRKSIQRKIHRLSNKYGKLEKEYQQAQGAEEHKIKGDLVMANLHRLSKGDRVLKAINFYDENQGEVSIALNPQLSPAANAQRFYKRYHKAKIALIEIKKQQRITKNEISYLQGVLTSIDHTQSLDDFQEIRDELEKEGYLRKKRKKEDKRQRPSQPLRFESVEGYPIFVGKNNRQNENITFKIAGREDYWFHIKDQAGSHVALITGGKEPSNESLLEAATLAAYYSRDRNATKIPVDYTKRKYVKSPKGSKPGMVIYEEFSTILVDALEENVSKIKKGDPS